MAYAAITVEGGMFPGDLLDRIAAGEGEGQRPADFGLAAGRRVTDETQAAFSEIRSYWEAFQYRLRRSSDSSTTLTRESWVIPFLQALGFEQIEFQRAAATVGGESYAISHRAGTRADATAVQIVALDQRLDARDGRRSPHALVQEYLNRSDCVWAMVSNGRQLRLLRDTARLAKPTYLEFNLEAMAEANLYSEFVLLFRLMHASRFPVDGAGGHECLLERYYQQGIEEGGKVREKLRDGVAEALNILGSAFLAHTASGALRARFAAGALDATAYYRQLLRLVYRLLFLMAAEERKLVFPSNTPVANQTVFDKYYSVARLRDRCERRFGEDRHSDLWLSLRQTFALLREDGLATKLGLHALNGELFGPFACADLESAGCTNRDLLAAIYRLSTYIDDRVRRRVNYAFLDVEEFGSVYESLLDFHPRVDLGEAIAPTEPAGVGAGLKPARETSARFAGVGAQFIAPASPRFELAAGSERKQTGSYYTPPELVRELIESALVPVVEERLAAARTKEAKEEALLALRVCDPAAGSGHFLLAAARRIARELARVRSEEAEPPPEAYRQALRDVIRSCIYAVDKNPLAVDLCKVALWIEGHNAGLPLSFLDNHVKCGDSLVGVFGLNALEGGIPDAVYAAVTGDDKQVATALRKRNKAEREGQMQLAAPAATLPAAMARQFGALGEFEERDPGDVRAKEELYTTLRSGRDWWTLKTACDLWTNAFFAPKRLVSTGGGPSLSPAGEGRGEGEPRVTLGAREEARVPTTDALRSCLRGLAVDQRLRGEANAASERLRFFHWPLEFPEVFEAGRFDVVLGNPPWERIKLQEQEFFAGRDHEIATAANKAARERLLKTLPERRPELAAEWERAQHDAEAQSAFVRGSGRFPLCGRGDVNTYSIFAEAARALVGPTGRSGVIVPSGIATDDTTKMFFQSLMDSRSLVSLYDFENSAGMFPGVGHGRYKFCLLTLSGTDRPAAGGADFVFYARLTDDLRETQRHFALTSEDSALLNPNTRTCPIFRSRRDAELTKAIYRRVPVLIRDGPPEENPWAIQLRQGLFHLTNDVGSGLLVDSHVRGQERSPDAVSVYEAKMVHQFDHRYGDYADEAYGLENTHLPDVPLTQLRDPDYRVTPRYWVQEAEVDRRLEGRWGRGWLLVYRDIARATDERTVIAAAVPRLGVAYTLRLAVRLNALAKYASCLVADLNGFVLDYSARQMLGGTHLSDYVTEQLPLLLPTAYDQRCPWSPSEGVADWIALRVLELTYTAWDLLPFGRDLGCHGPPFVWDDGRRFLLRCELDAAFFHLYGIEGGDVGYIMETFPIVKRHDEQRHGEYRTKRVILEIYDAMQRAIETGEPYRTRLVPPPADPRVAHRAADLRKVAEEPGEYRAAHGGG